nr:putative mediator of RNA polymerase II transcription subunit 12 [Drosophila takahashii]
MLQFIRLEPELSSAIEIVKRPVKWHLSPLKLYSYKYHYILVFRHQTLHSQTSNKMKTFCLTLALCACLAAADVSHLQPGSSYLPPPRPEHAVSMSIEQQELRELPEQVEYMRPNEQGQMEPMPSSLLTPPAPVDQQEEAVPSTRYLPPAPVAAAPVQMDAEPMMMPQMEMAPEEVVMEKLQEQPELANRYLPPAPVSEQQLTYQQYQEQMQQFQMQEQQQQDQQPQEEQPQQFQDQPAAEEEQQMPYILDVQQPMAPSDVETQEQLEPEPAHELRADGYHYKQAEEHRRLRH